MSKIFLIAGLGADTRAYNNINLGDNDVICVDWIEPHQTDSLKTYAQKLIYQYNIQPDSIIIGNSLGGMIAMEIAQFIPVKQTILISSIKTIDEAPWYFKFFKVVPVCKLIPGKLITSMGFMIRFMFGKISEVDKWLFNDMLKNSSPMFIKWAMGAAVRWDNKIISPNTCTITGNKDKVFDYRKINDAIIIEGGTHIMIVDRAKELNKVLKKIVIK